MHCCTTGGKNSFLLTLVSSACGSCSRLVPNSAPLTQLHHAILWHSKKLLLRGYANSIKLEVRGFSSGSTPACALAPHCSTAKRSILLGTSFSGWQLGTAGPDTCALSYHAASAYPTSVLGTSCYAWETQSNFTHKFVACHALALLASTQESTKPCRGALF